MVDRNACQSVSRCCVAMILSRRNCKRHLENSRMTPDATGAVIVIGAQQARDASLLLRAQILTSQAEVRKITLHQVYLPRQAAPRPSVHRAAEHRGAR